MYKENQEEKKKEIIKRLQEGEKFLKKLNKANKTKPKLKPKPNPKPKSKSKSLLKYKN